MLIDLLLPQRCVVCSSPGEQVCDACTSSLRRLRPPWCERCGAPTAWPVRRCSECSGRHVAYARARAALAYDAPVRRVVLSWKERGLRRLARWAAAVVVDTLEPPDVACLVYVPPDADRRLRRGHHPAEQLARELGAVWGVSVEPALVRVRGSPRQRGLTRAERGRNVRSAFRATRRVPPSVGLVDDVYTTGATAGAAASALRQAGARRVEVVTLARTLRTR